MDSREFPSNAASRNQGPPQKQKEKMEPVVQGTVVRRRKGLGKRFSETFVGGETRGVGSFIAMDILIPAAKDMIVDAFTMGVERMVFGDVRPGSRRHSNVFRQGSMIMNQRTNYQQPGMGQGPRAIEPRRSRANLQFDEVILSSRAEADEVLARMVERIEQYGAVTVADMCDALNEEAPFTYHRYGWVDLGYARVSRARGGGYLLDLPRPEPLD